MANRYNFASVLKAMRVLVPKYKITTSPRRDVGAVVESASAVEGYLDIAERKGLKASGRPFRQQSEC